MRCSMLTLSIYLVLAVSWSSLAAWAADPPISTSADRAASSAAMQTPPPPAQPPSTVAPSQSGVVPPPPLSSVNGPQEPPRDPTQPSPQMRDLLTKPKSQDLPPLELKGRILTAGQTPLALLALDKHLFVVRQGAEISLDGSYSGMSIRVAEITGSEVRLEIVPLGRSMFLY